MKFLIAGLGNIGDEYAGTRHNIGFTVADAFVESHAHTDPIRFESGRYASVAIFKFRGKIMIVIKPSTYMNLSGNAVGYWMKKENIAKENLLVITDDIALPFGTLRLKPKGSDGGHNGLRNIQETLGTIDYARLRFGVGNEFGKGKQVDYVLGKWNEEENKSLRKNVEQATEMIDSFLIAGLQLTMTRFNK